MAAQSEQSLSVSGTDFLNFLIFSFTFLIFFFNLFALLSSRMLKLNFLVSCVAAESVSADI